jgi:hypothetical protein
MGDSAGARGVEIHCMSRGLVVALLAAVVAGVGAGRADASGGRYVFAGGTAEQQATVVSALDASSFNWNLVPGTTTIRIARGLGTEALPGEVRLDADLLDSGVFAWGVVQHEYAHQVDFFLLTQPMRLALLDALEAGSWWGRGIPHDALGGERFASTLAWSYWPSRQNVLRPASRRDEAGSVAPAAFRALLQGLLGDAPASNAPVAPSTPAHAPRTRKR